MSELKGTLAEGYTLTGTASVSPYIPERMAHKLTFTGAVEAEYDGGTDVTVEIPEGSSVTPEAVASAVEAYMAEHPVEESDPTVLPNPNKLTFSGAVEAEYDGSEAVEVVIPQGGGGGADETYRLVVDTTTTEDVANFFFSEDMDGNPLSLRKFIFQVVFATATADKNATIGVAHYRWLGNTHNRQVGSWYGMKYISYGTRSQDWWGEFCLNVEADKKNAVLFKRVANFTYSNNNCTTDSGTWHRLGVYGSGSTYYFMETIDGIELNGYNADYPIPAGTTIKIWGVDA